MKSNTKFLCLVLGCVLSCGKTLEVIAQDTNIDWGTASDDQVILQAIELTTPTPSNDVPAFATFYSAQHSPISAQPWPPLPGDMLDFDAWDLGSNVWVLDDLGYNYDAPPMQASQSMMALDDSGIYPPGGGTNSVPPAGLPVPFDPGTNLWIAQEVVTNGIFAGILSNTIPGVEYQLLSVNSLNSSQWAYQGGPIMAYTNWMPWSVPFDPTTNFFLNALSFQDSSGTGIPDWWWLKYFGQDTNTDPYADPVGDGYTLYQDYVNGWVPTNWMQPPAPTGLTVDGFNSASGTATLCWLPSPGPVTGYAIQTPNGTIPLGNVTSYIDNESSIGATYSVEADYGGQTSAWSAQVSTGGDPAPNAAVVSGPEGNLYLVTSGLPPDLAAIQISRYSWNSGGPLDNEFPQCNDYVNQGNFPLDPLANGSFQIPAADITNGICEISSSEVTPFFLYQFEITTIRSNGVTSVQTQSGSQYGAPLAEVPFTDGRVDFKDNLRFLLRAGSDDKPYTEDTGPFGFSDATYSYSSFGWAPDHICVDFYSDGNNEFGYQYISSIPNPLEPLEDNIFYKNFVLDVNNLTTNPPIPDVGGPPLVIPNTGITYPNPSQIVFNHGSISSPGVNYYFNLNGFLADPVVPPSAISAANSVYIIPSSFEALFNFDNDFPHSGDTNVYGLSFVACEGAWYTNNAFYTQTYYPGDPNINGWTYLDAKDPGFQITNYYFCRPDIDPMPEDMDFAATNTTPLIIVPVGAPSTQLAGYAQLAVTNGYREVYGYIGQYFTNAYQIAANGQTTNSAGIISPYGQFFATQPGPAALVTMPDPDTGQQGTCTVYCVSLQVDKNHDGVMDTLFNGSDATSQANPMEFWVNDGCDVPGVNGGYDQDLQIPPNPTNYLNDRITCQRDLENFGRLWICGMPSLPTNGAFQVTLSWAHTTDNPAINLYASVETNGGTAYLTDTNIAELQCAINVGGSFPDLTYSSPGFAIATNIAPGYQNEYTFPADYFANGGNQYFLFEGAGTGGSGELMLTIYQNGNVIAQTGIWLDLHNVQDFFEHPRASDVSLAGPPTTNTGAFTIDSYETTKTPLEDSNIIIYVHGVNTTQFYYEDDSASVFKRFYWQGYNGRYVAFRWPSPLWGALSGLIAVNTNQVTVLNYNKTEYVGWQSGLALKYYIDGLRTRFPGYQVNVLATSGGGVVANEAIRSGAHVDNFAMLVVSLPAEAFDGSNPNLIYDYLADGGANTPDTDSLGGYNNCFTNAARIVNFYNDDDYACFTGPAGAWEFAQKYTRPDQSYTIPNFTYDFDGTNCFFKEIDDNGLTISSRTLTQDFEKKSYVARSRTKAIGAAGLKYSPYALAGGAITANVSLQDASLGFVGGAQFGNSREDHSGEVKKPIQCTTPLYKEFLNEGFLISSPP